MLAALTPGLILDPVGQSLQFKLPKYPAIWASVLLVKVGRVSGVGLLRGEKEKMLM